MRLVDAAPARPNCKSKNFSEHPNVFASDREGFICFFVSSASSRVLLAGPQQQAFIFEKR